MASFIVDPSLTLIASYFLHNSVVTIQFLHRLIIFQSDQNKMIGTFNNQNISTQLYWIVISLSGILFVVTLERFFRKTAKTNLTSPNLLIPTIILTIGTILVTALSVIAFVTPVNYNIVRIIIAFIYFLGSALLIRGIGLEMSELSSSTAIARLYIFRLIIYLLLAWLFISFLLAPLRLFTDFGTPLYFFISIFILCTAGLSSIISSILIIQIITIPDWIRKKYNISKDRFQKYSEMSVNP